MSKKLIPTHMQEEDADALLEYQHGYLWSEPGTGKTLTALRAFEKGGYTGGVVIAPKLALAMWQQEIQTQLGQHNTAALLRQNVTTMPIERINRIKECDWIITTYTIATRKEVQAILKEHLVKHKSALIIDEAHYAKTKGAKRTDAIFMEAPGLKREYKPAHGMPMPATMQRIRAGIAFSADSVWQLTGTPQTRWPDDLWTQLRFGRKDILQHYGVAQHATFQRTFCEIRPMKMHGRTIDRITGARNLTLLGRLLKDCKVVRRTLEEAASELPPIRHRDVPVEVSVPAGPEIITDRDKLLAMLADKGGEYAKLYAVLGLSKVEQVCEHVETQVPHQVLIGMWHRAAMTELYNLIKQRMPDRSVVQVHGGTPDAQRERYREAFNSGELNIIIGQMSAMNVSWNLQESAHHVVLGEQLPSPALVDQFYKRVYRKGQQHTVQVDNIIAEHWLDETISLIREEKQKGMEETVYAT